MRKWLAYCLLVMIVITMIGCSAINCEHRYNIKLATYAAPSDTYIREVRGSSNSTTSYYATVQRIKLGVTTIIYKCSECGSEYKEMLLGKEVSNDG